MTLTGGPFLSLMWAIPFIGLIFSLALLPLCAKKIWDRHYGKVGLFWVLTLLVPLYCQQGVEFSGHLITHVFLGDYLPFIIMVTCLYILAGGIRLTLSAAATPLINVVFLLCGTFFASIVGTTGAAMILIRPFLELNKHRNIRRHLVVFFIFLIANIGGSLSPMGDPPLFLGFLKGVPFFWPLQNLFFPMLAVVLPLLCLCYGIDLYYFHKEKNEKGGVLYPQETSHFSWVLEGKVNLLLLGFAICLILLSASHGKEVLFTWWGVPIRSNTLWREGGLIALAVSSLKFTPPLLRIENRFSWHPVKEVAKLFCAIFITVAPLVHMLEQGKQGPFASLLSFLNTAEAPSNQLFFWMTGALSAFLDNAPTYLIFLNFAGGDIALLTTSLKSTLVAISSGAVFMGALTYIGNAPNFMVKSIAEEDGIKMPSFFKYMVWSCGILLPLFILVSMLYFS